MEKRVYLPEEIISQIITSSGLDLKSMIKFMAVSKRWPKLVSDLISNNPHLGAKAQFLVYDSGQRRFGALDEETNQIASMSGEPNRKIVKLLGAPSCNGLVCFLSNDNKDIYICNPLTGEYISIPCLEPRESVSIYQCNLGFCSSSNEYKLTCLRIGALQTYTLGTSAGWRIVPFHHEVPWCWWRGAICVNGVFHWLFPRTKSIVTFDLATEVLAKTPPPRLEDGKEIYQVDCMDNCLVVTAGYHPPLGMDIWVRKEDKSSGESVWTKNWVIDAAQPLIQVDFCYLVPQKLSTDGCIIMRDYAYRNLCSYDFSGKLVRRLWHHKDDRKLHSYYTPTLISPKSLMKKKMMDNDE